MYDEEVLKKIEHSKNNNKPIDGHAPGLRGDGVSKYIAAGISTDHECFTYEEALEKLQKGMKINHELILKRTGTDQRFFSYFHRL